MGGWRGHTHPQEQPDLRVGDRLKENIDRLRKEYRSDINEDFIVRSFMMGGRIPAAAVFMDGMANPDQINDFILKPSMQTEAMQNAKPPLAQYAIEHVLAMQDANLTQDWNDVKTAVSEGRTAVLLDGDDHAVLMDTRGFPSRAFLNR